MCCQVHIRSPGLQHQSAPAKSPSSALASSLSSADWLNKERMLTRVRDSATSSCWWAQQGQLREDSEFALRVDYLEL